MVENNVKITVCKDKKEASELALKLLLGNIDSDTLLLLSGGTSLDLLYQFIAQDQTLKSGAVALIDERFGLPMHENSNEKMIKSTGLIDYLNDEEVPFYKILTGKELETTADRYEQTMKELFKKFPKKVAIMGIGADGHTAGIKPNLGYDHQRLVVAYDDNLGTFGKRITLTLEALEQINRFVALAFGENKRNALKEMFETSDEYKIPAAFYTKVPAEVVLLTDIE